MHESKTRQDTSKRTPGLDRLKTVMLMSMPLGYVMSKQYLGIFKFVAYLLFLFKRQVLNFKEYLKTTFRTLHVVQKQVISTLRFTSL